MNYFPPAGFKKMMSTALYKCAVLNYKERIVIFVNFIAV